MPRQSVTLTEKNDEWLKLQVDSVGDYANKSELINDLVRRARRAEYMSMDIKNLVKSKLMNISKVSLMPLKR